MREAFYRKPDGTIVFHAIEKVGGDAPAIDFSPLHHYHSSGRRKNDPDLMQISLAQLTVEK